MRQIENKMVKRSYNYIKWRWTKSQLKDTNWLKKKKKQDLSKLQATPKKYAFNGEDILHEHPDGKTNKKRLLQTVITKLKRERQ